MLDIKYIIDHVDDVKQNITNKQMNVDIDALLAVYEKLKDKKNRLQDIQAEKNKMAAQFKSGEIDKDEIQKKSKEQKQELTTLKEAIEKLEKDYTELMLQVPNITASDVPVGKDDHENVEVSKYLEPTQFDFDPKDHVTLGKELDILDFDLGAKVTGSKFYFLKNEGVLLEQALINFALRKAMEKGFTPMTTPDLARDEIIVGAGFTPRGNETQIYSIENSDLSLIGTAEITLGGIMQNEFIDEDKLPLKLVGLSHCFRTEAGGYGRESKGLYRVHQFSKIELYVFTKEDQSERMHEELRALEEEIYQDLGIPYHVVNVCTGDLGAPAYKKYDIEAWMPGHSTGGAYGEITSASNCTDFQARRLNIKYKDAQTKKNVFVHTLNGTAIAVSRTMIAILENFQQKDGSVVIPTCLVPYTGFEKIGGNG